MGTILFLTGSTMGDALGASGRALEHTFRNFGYAMTTVNLAANGAIDTLNQTLAKGDIEFAFTHIGMGMDIVSRRQDGLEANVWDAMRIPFMSFNGDSPAYFFDRHVVPGSAFASLYVFPEHAALRRRLPAVRGMTGVTPPVLQDALPKKDVDFAQKEAGKLLFLKNGNDPEALLMSWREALPEHVFVMLADIAGELAGRLDDPVGNDIDTVVVDYLRARGMEIDTLVKLRLLFVAQLDDYLRRVKSTLIVKALLDLPVEVHGFNWDHVDFSGRRAKLIGNADFAASRELIRNSLGIIDMSPNTGQAPHDRPMRAFARHTLCLTNRQSFFEAKVPSLCDAFSYRFDSQSIQSMAADAIAHPRQHVELGIEVASAFAHGYEIEILAQYMLEVAACLRAEGSSRHPAFQPYFAWPPAKIA